MSYNAHAIEEAAPLGLQVHPARAKATLPASGHANEKAKRAENRQLAIAAQGGCIESFEALVEQFEKPLYRFLLTKTGNHHQAEDLVQDTFLITYRKLNRFNPAYPFSSWIFTIANRLAISYFRKQKPMQEEHDIPTDKIASVRGAGRRTQRNAVEKSPASAVGQPLHGALAVLHRGHDHRAGRRRHEPQAELD